MNDTQTDDAIRLLLKEEGADQQSIRDDTSSQKTKQNQRNSTGNSRRDTTKSIAWPFMRRLWTIVRRRPATRKQILIAALALLILFRPWLVFWVILLTFVTLVIVYLSLGPDDCAEKIAKVYRRFAQRQPEKAEKLRQRASSALKRLGVLLEKLPEHWTRGLYLPDLDGTPSELDDQPDPFDRLGEQPK